MSCLIVATIYLVHGALEQDRLMHRIGVALALAVAVGVHAGVTEFLAVQAVLGGGALLTGALLGHRGRVREKRG